MSLCSVVTGPNRTVTLPRPPEWMSSPERMCDPERLEVHPDAFFAPEGAERNAAKAACERCIFQRPCLEWAVATGQQAGVWGGKPFYNGARPVVNQAEPRKPGPTRTQQRIARDAEIKRLHEQGRTEMEVARVTGVHPRTVRNSLERQGLIPAGKKRVAA